MSHSKKVASSQLCRANSSTSVGAIFIHQLLMRIHSKDTASFANRLRKHHSLKRIKMVLTKGCAVSPGTPFLSWMYFLYIVADDYLVLGEKKRKWAIKIILVILASVSFPCSQIERRVSYLLQWIGIREDKARPSFLEEALNDGDFTQCVFLQAVTKTWHE